MQYHPAKGGKGKQHGCFFVFWISPAVNSTKSFKYLAEKGYCWFLEPFAMLFMQLKGRGDWHMRSNVFRAASGEPLQMFRGHVQFCTGRDPADNPLSQ
jgi:hypothetical protein